jgi:hypothetical protein
MDVLILPSYEFMLKLFVLFIHRVWHSVYTNIADLSYPGRREKLVYG